MERPYSTGLNAAVLHMANRCLPTGFDVSSDAPDTFVKLLNRYWQTGRICVWDGASEGTLYADKEVNYAFRAWHDWAHITGFADFTLDGEKRACSRQLATLFAVYGIGKQSTEWGRLIHADVVGQGIYYHAHGAFPDPQRAFSLAYAMAETDTQRQVVLSRTWHAQAA